MEHVKDEAIEMLSKYKELYDAKVEELFKSQYDIDSAPFWISNVNKFEIYVFYDDVGLYGGINEWNYMAILESNSTDEKFIVNILKYSDYIDLIDHQYIEHDFQYIPEIMDYIDIAEKTLKLLFKSGLYVAINNPSRLNSDIRQDLMAYNSQLGNPSNEVVYRIKRYKYTLYDIEKICDVITTPELGIYLQEGIFCYEHMIYHAAAAMFAVALEEVAYQGLLLCGIDPPDGNDEKLFTYINLLKKNGLFDNRVRRRLINASMTRNLATHQSSGYIVKSDCDSIMTSIIELVDILERN